MTLAGDSGLRETLEAEIEALLDHVNAGLEDYAKVAYAVVVAQRWTVENGLLTPTLKIKRNALETLYMRNADAWLASRRRVIWEGQ